MKNSFENMHFPLNKQALAYRDKRGQELMNHPTVIAFLDKHDLDDDFVFSHISQFDMWLKVIEKDPSVASYQREGYDFTLHYEDGFLDFIYVQTPQSYQVEKEFKHLNYYLVNHLPEPMKKLSLSQLDLKSESSQYQLLVSKIVDLLSKNKGVYLHGSIGSGKTHLMASIANDYARKKKMVCFVRMGQLLSELKSLFDDVEAYNRLMDGLLRCQLLIIDDIGAENVSSWGRDDILFNLLNTRMENQQLTCFTSNLSINKLKEVYLSQQYGIVDENKVARLIERIETLARPQQLFGESRRDKNF